ncbi:hypothetical protein [Ornithinimicrobium sediminis]|uniref:hypothetical protein n=1 Tax=Ornithinimicrobium sediminis TaxID=2904603 RepID=UPI001E451A40|nr:hypothetical protein [Ornithinimicrobium sediminis]MCE0486386.1 hypothetical protein [Ornithinimicrobium sediminis]
MNEPAGTGYLDVWTGISLALGLVVAGICGVAALRGRPPGRVTVGATLVLQAVLLAYTVRYLVVSLQGQSPVGPVWELWAYLVTVVLLPAVGLLWARDEHTRWGTLVLAAAAFIAAVMCGRVAQIWAGVGFS